MSQRGKNQLDPVAFVEISAMACHSSCFSGRSFLFSCALTVAMVSGCATTVSGRLEGPDLGPDALRDARVNVTRLDASAAPTNVDAMNPDETASMILVPEEDGSFVSTHNLPKGKYLIEALVPGYEPVSQKIDLTKSQRINLVLKPIGQARTKTLDINNDPAASRGEGGAVLTLPQF